MSFTVLTPTSVLKGPSNMIRSLWNPSGKCESCTSTLRCLSRSANMIASSRMRSYPAAMTYVNGNFDSSSSDAIIGKIVGVKSLSFNSLNKVSFPTCSISFPICLSFADRIYLAGRYFRWSNRNLYFPFLNSAEVCTLFLKALNKEWSKLM